MRVLFCTAVISAGTIGAVLAFGANTVAAAADCITEPNRDPPEGSHWYYRADRATDRKCWYLRALIQGTPQVPAAETQRASARPAAAPTVRRGKAPLSESEEAALYLEFLRWKEQQRTAQ